MEDTLYGMSAVLRNSEGEFLTATSSVLIGTALIAEVEASTLLAAIAWTIDKGYNNVIFQIDCKHVHDLLQSSSNNLGSFWFFCKHNLSLINNSLVSFQIKLTWLSIRDSSMVVG